LSAGVLTRGVDRFENTRPADRDWWRELWPEPVAVLAELGLEAGESVADACCGDGHFAIPAAELVEPAPVYAVDVDGTLLDEIEARAVERGVENVVTVSGDVRELSSLLPERVDVVLLANTFHGVEAPTAFAEQVFRSLQPGGRFLIVNWRDLPREETTVLGEPRGPPPALRMTPEETRSAVAPAGFEVVREVDLPPYHYGLVFRRAHDA
jgi:SAM-dependent methyltransferase